MYRTSPGALLVTVYALLTRAVLEPELLAYLLLVEPYDDLAVSTISCMASRSVRIFFSIKSMFLSERNSISAWQTLQSGAV
jgi:hypothetical protein